MTKNYTVTFRNIKSVIVDDNSTYYDVSKYFKRYYDYDIVLCKANNDFVDLSDKVKRNCDIDFYDRSSLVGNRAYARGARYILLLAVEKVLGSSAKLVCHHSQDKGVYCVINNASIDADVILKIEREMHRIVDSNYVFEKNTVSRMDAIKYFSDKGMMDKVNVLKYVSNTYINLYKVDGKYGYFYGKMPYSTGQVKDFKLIYIDNNGFVMQLPDTINPECVLEYKHYKKVFDKFNEYTKWGNNLNIVNAADLNKVVSSGNISELIRLSETYYNKQLSDIADEIEKSGKKVVLIAGPSSSGKTTTAKKLAVYLKSLGYTPHPISIDDYFFNVSDRQKDENGEYNFETLDVVDVELFNQHLTKLLEGKEVILPIFNFTTGRREYRKEGLKIDEKDIIIIEGIHALNDKLTMTLNRSEKFKIYISPLTQINIDSHTHVHTSDTRKLRRIIRDNKTRSKGASETLKMWGNITKGEINNIFPYQDSVDAVINSALIYELGVLKTYAEPLLFNVKEDSSEYPEALRLIRFLRNFLAIPSEDIPSDSLLREFIGGSSFE